MWLWVDASLLFIYAAVLIGTLFFSFFKVSFDEQNINLIFVFSITIYLPIPSSTYTQLPPQITTLLSVKC